LRRWLEVTPQNAVALVQEPWNRHGKIRGLSGMRGNLINSNSVNARASIFIKGNLNVQPLMDFCSRDLCAVSITASEENTHTKVIFASAYMPLEASTPPVELADLIRYCEKEGEELVVSTDANAHHPLWGMEEHNNRGNQLVEFLISTNIEIVNKGNEPTFIGRHTRTIIDLTLATPATAERISNWHVSSEASCSDHRWIRFDIQMCSPKIEPRRYPRKTNKKQYSTLVNKELTKNNLVGKIHGITAIEQEVSKLNSILTSSYHNSCPLQTPRLKENGKHHW
jgi:hypothetical protein